MNFFIIFSNFSRFFTCCENNFKFKIFGNLQWGLDNVFCNIDSWLFLSILMTIIKDKKSILIYKKSRINEYQKFFKIQDEQFLFGVCKEIELHGRDHLTYNLERQTSFFKINYIIMTSHNDSTQNSTSSLNSAYPILFKQVLIISFQASS